MMMKQMLATVLLSVLSLPLIAGDAPIVSGIIGASSIKNLPAGPDAVVMKDRAGNEALVVFYRVGNKLDQAGFVVAKNIGAESGALFWEPQQYRLTPMAMSADETAPAPVIYNDVLYLFGRVHYNNQGRYFVYNSFEYLEDLIAQTDEEGDSNVRGYIALRTDGPDNDDVVRGQEELGHVSATVVDGTLLVSYYERNEKDSKKKNNLPVSSSRCIVWSGKLSCTPVIPLAEKFHDPAVLVPVTVDGVQETLMLVKKDEKMSVNQLDLAHNKWVHLYDVSNLQLGGQPIGALEINGKLNAYYKRAEAGMQIGILESSVFLSDVLHTGSYWLPPEENSAVRTDLGVKAIVFKNRVYVLFNGPDTLTNASHLLYYSDTTID